jgi:tripartite-type tricarboxylate transporter receptor subunit TctC
LKSLFAGFAFALASLGTATSALADDYPNRTVRIVVPLPAGSLPDQLGRAIATRLQNTYKQSFVVEDKPGASTLVGAKDVATSAPDGYTLLLPTVTTLSLAPQLLKDSGFDPLKEVTPIAVLGATNFFLVVTPDFPARSVAEWIAEVKKHPGKYTYASSGNGSPQNIFMELLKKQLGLDIVHIPYKGSNGGMTDLLSQKVNMALLDGSLVLPYLDKHQLYPLGTTMAKGSKVLPSVPPIAQTVPGFDWSGWLAFGGPANLPAPVVDKIATEIRALQATPEYAALLARGAMEPLDPLTPSQMREFVKKEYDRWGPAIKASGATID